MALKNVISSFSLSLFLLISTSAPSAVFVDSYRYSSGEESPTYPAGTLLSAITGLGVVFELDAALAASVADTDNYWKNAETAPADSSAQSAYDFANIGAVPFVSDDESSYWNPGSGDYFQIGSNTTLLSALHKGTTSWWVAIAFGSDGSWGSRSMVLTTTGDTAADPGIINRGDLDEGFDILQGGDTGTSTFLNIGSSAATGGNLMVITYDHTAGEISYARNSTTLTTGDVTFNASTTNGLVATIGATPDGSNTSAEWDFYHVSMGNTVMTDARLAEIHDLMNTRHSRDYTP